MVGRQWEGLGGGGGGGGVDSQNSNRQKGELSAPNSAQTLITSTAKEETPRGRRAHTVQMAAVQNWRDGRSGGQRVTVNARFQLATSVTKNRASTQIGFFF